MYVLINVSKTKTIYTIYTLIIRMRVIIPILVLILLVSSAFAQFDYTQTGGSSDDFSTSLTSLTTIDEDETTTSSKSFTGARDAPLVADLDNDGVNEIIGISDGSINLYQTKSLTPLETFTISNEVLSNFFAFDIDGDDLVELIYAQVDSEILNILEYNGTSFYNETSIDLSGLTHAGSGDMLLSCRFTNDCFMAFSSKSAGGGGAGVIYGLFFNSTDIGAETSLVTASWANAKFCSPFVKTIVPIDYDSDDSALTELEYNFGMYENDAVGELSYYLLSVQVTGTTPVLERHVRETDFGDYTLSSPLTCADADRRAMSGPLIMDIDGFSGTLETIIAMQTDSDRYVMLSYRKDADGTDPLEISFPGGTRIDDYPETADAIGTLISPLFKTNAFDNTGKEDFCVLGYNGALNATEMTCGSEQQSTFPIDQETVKLTLSSSNFEGLYDIDETVSQYNTMVHSINWQSGNNPGASADLDEILTTYGVFQIDYSFDDELLVLYEISTDNGAVIPVDAEKLQLVNGNPRNDLILVDSTNIRYIDDGFSNSQAVRSDTDVSPCNGDWQVNTSIEVDMVLTDADEDTVIGRVTAYSGESNEQVVVDNGSSGATLSFILKANQTTANSILKIEWWDSGTNIVQELNKNFVVANTGLEASDCTETLEDQVLTSTEINGSLTEIQTDLTENNIATGLDSIVAFYGFNSESLGRQVGWLIMMLVLALTIIFQDNKMNRGTENPQFTLIMVVISEILMLVLGVYLGFLSFGMLLTLIVLSLIVLGFWIKRMFTSDGGGM